MDYELALELKNAGFPQRPSKSNIHGSWYYLPSIDGGFKPYLTGLEDYPKGIYIPTLEEVIDECGNGFGSLNKSHDSIWWATHINNVNGNGESPIEAVARLYLQLHAKKN